MYSSVQNTCTQSERQATLENLFPGIGVATCHCSAKTVHTAKIHIFLREPEIFRKCPFDFWIRNHSIGCLEGIRIF